MSHPPIIGSRYDGPALDKPCIRQMPRHWYLEEQRKDPTDWGRLGIILIVLALLLSCAQMVKVLS